MSNLSGLETKQGIKDFQKYFNSGRWQNDKIRHRLCIRFIHTEKFSLMTYNSRKYFELAFGK
jgi:hypothetical protein